MRVLATTFVYNERPYIGDWVRWYGSQGCDLFVLDNHSDDGTYEWLEENGVACARFDTGGAFHLHRLQDELMVHVRRLRPDWVIYAGADLFCITGGVLSEDIELIDSLGFDQLRLPCYDAVSTGEAFGLPLQSVFTRGMYYKELTMIGRYGDGFSIRNDNVAGCNPFTGDGIMVNYGRCKPRLEQEEKLRRRELAWGMGLPGNIGRHFRRNKGMGWVVPFEGTLDLRAPKLWRYLSRIQW